MNNTAETGGLPLRPKALSVVAENIPAELKQLNQWVTWRYDFDESRDAWTKVPYRVHGRALASSTDPSTWASFDDAIERYRNGGVDGIGFVVTAENNFVGIDLDHFFDVETRKGEQWAIELIQKFSSYSRILAIGPRGSNLRQGQLT